MTTTEMETALATGFNKQGRSLSTNMRIKYLVALSNAPRQTVSIGYREMLIGGIVGRYSVEENGRLWPRSFTSVEKAKDAIDRCYAIRTEV